MFRLACFAVLTCLVTACSPESGEGGDPAQPAADAPARSVVLFTIDTLRADRLSPYGNRAYATPAAERLAAQSLVFDRAYSQADNTNPSVTSMLTGLTPPRHGVLSQVTGTRPEVVSLAGMLSANGVATGSFVANLCKLQDVPESVFYEGWNERFCGMDKQTPQHKWGELCVDAGLEWIAEQHAAGNRFFAWIHLMDPHSEYDPRPEHWDHRRDPLRKKIPQLQYYSAFEESLGPPPAEDLERLLALYDAEVKGADDQLMRALDFLDGLEGSEDVAFLMSADHGEELYETWHRIGHGFSLTEGVLRVPLMIRAQGVEPGRVDAPVETLAITPTILQLMGARAPYELDAKSLLDGTPTLPYARSYTVPMVVTVRSDDTRYWLREGDEAPSRKDANWRLQAPWFLQQECMATYVDDAPSTPSWVELVGADRDAPGAALRTAGRRTLADAIKGAEEGTEITDPAYLQQLKELGYLDASDDD
jgi:arylsulfatase A-like enzyme